MSVAFLVATMLMLNTLDMPAHVREMVATILLYTGAMVFAVGLVALLTCKRDTRYWSIDVMLCGVTLVGGALLLSAS